MTNTEIIKKLIGSIEPCGASHIDKKRFENLQDTCLLVENLINDIKWVALKNKDRQEYSMKEMGEYAYNFLMEIGIKENQ